MKRLLAVALLVVGCSAKLPPGVQPHECPAGSVFETSELLEGVLRGQTKKKIVAACIKNASWSHERVWEGVTRIYDAQTGELLAEKEYKNGRESWEYLRNTRPPSIWK